MQHSVVSYSAIKLESAYPAHPPGIAFDYNYNYYNPNPSNNSNFATTAPAPSSTLSSGTMSKRALSDSDCEDLFTDTKDSCITPPGSDAGGVNNVSRKKRRGIIEKRRRDRINNSLSELRRLVPTAFEKQGSAKLEKAEILQMTVDHLKMLHSKGLDALAYDPHKFAMDYHSIGFRECAAEVARYLVTVEGMDIQDPLRLRLMSHLQCFAAQRELANKQASASSWGLNPLTPNHSYSLQTHHLSSANSANSGGLPVAPPLQPSAQHPSSLMEGSPTTNHQNYLNSSTSSSNHTSPAMPHDPLSNNSNQGLPHGGHMGSYQKTLFPPPPPNHHSHHIPREYATSLSAQHPNGSPMTSSPYGMTNHQNYPVQSGKPYRPWGAELAY